MRLRDDWRLWAGAVLIGIWWNPRAGVTLLALVAAGTLIGHVFKDQLAARARRNKAYREALSGPKGPPMTPGETDDLMESLKNSLRGKGVDIT